MSKKELRIELWPLENLIPYDLNAKKHEPDQVQKIAKSILKLGFDVPIVVDKHGVIIKGHGRRMALISLVDQGFDKYKNVPVVIRDDLSPEEVRAARLADNRVALSDVDPEKLRAELEALDYDLSGIFDSKELEFMEADLGQMNVDAFVTDMDATVSEQKQDLDSRLDAANKKVMPLAKAFGFKDVPGGGQIVITQLMALAEATTQKQGGDALIDYLRQKLPVLEGA